MFVAEKQIENISICKESIYGLPIKVMRIPSLLI